MRTLNQTARLLMLLLCCVLATVAIAQQAKTSSKKSTKASVKATAVHPEVDPSQECSSCHEAEHKQWNDSRHATGGVLCIVCHGSLTENFMKQPAMSRCQGCHAAQVESLKVSASPRKTGNACFTCHAPHTLKVKKEGMKSPHATAGFGGNQ